MDAVSLRIGRRAGTLLLACALGTSACFLSLPDSSSLPYRCGGNADCVAGYVCRDGFCAALRTQGADVAGGDGATCVSDQCLPPCGTGAPCDDHDDCTFNTSCTSSGACEGTTLDCHDDPGPCGARRSCNGTAYCTVSWPGQETPCDDKQACTEGGHCNGAGGCEGLVPSCPTEEATCARTVDCDGNGGCTYDNPLWTTPCTDNDPCTHSEHCSGSGYGPEACVWNSVTVCPNGPSPCVISTCNVEGGCDLRFAEPGTPCDDGNICTVDDVCDDKGGCAGLLGTPVYRCHDAAKDRDYYKVGWPPVCNMTSCVSFENQGSVWRLPPAGVDEMRTLYLFATGIGPTCSSNCTDFMVSVATTVNGGCYDDWDGAYYNWEERGDLGTTYRTSFAPGLHPLYSWVSEGVDPTRQFVGYDLETPPDSLGATRQEAPLGYACPP
jgi:hypothetical protein